ncbi:MAG TPA: glycosyltransferase [Acidimicrobiales bacterium]|nr:glycosyltransferase [Acidimicrobiales bacterium]
MGGDGTPRISVCIVTGRRIPMLHDCLRSVAAQVDPPTFEVLVCSDGDHDVADAVRSHFPEAIVGFVASALPGAARNLLVERASGDLLLFLDDDATLRPDALRRLDELAAQHPEAAVFGGPNDTPPGSSRFQAVQGAVLASLVGSGPVRRRYGAHPPTHADERFFILCNLAVRRSAMVPFVDDLVCAEENAMLTELARNHVVMFYDPDLVAYHERRPTLRGFLAQMHKYGRGRGQVTLLQPSSLRPAYVAPSALVAYLLVALPLAWWAGPLALAPLAAYAAAVLASALVIARTLRQLSTVPLAASLTVLLHVWYGVGVVRGLVPSRGRAAPALEWLERPAGVPTVAAADD